MIMNKKIYISTLSLKGFTLSKIIKIVKDNKLSGIDLAPLTIFKSWRDFEKNLNFFKKKLSINKIKINAIQGIFFKKNYNLFQASDEKINDINGHLDKIIEIAKALKVKKIIIGSTKFRDKKNINNKIADLKFVRFFQRFQNKLEKNKIFFCLETVPKQYEENYIFNISRMVNIINKINCKNILINFDTSLFHFKNLNFKEFIKSSNKIKNIQISQKNFIDFKILSENNKNFLINLNKHKSYDTISLEMILNKPSEKQITDSITNIKEIFNQ